MSKEQKISNGVSKKIVIGIVTLILFGTIVAVAKNNGQQININSNREIANKTQIQSAKNSVNKIEVYYFHRTQRCYSCNILSRYAREMIEQKFSEEIESGKIEFREINIDLPENKNVAGKFQASGSSLFINAIKDGQDNISQDANVWRLLNNRSQFENHLTDKINSLLGK